MADEEPEEGVGHHDPRTDRWREEGGNNKIHIAMQSLKAHVKGGRLVLDEPTDLPEGAEVELVAVDDDDFDPEERARLLQAIEEGVADFERGDHMDGFEFVAQLRARREASSR
jgi:hypothetical protein